jgi:hypothetical protein
MEEKMIGGISISEWKKAFRQLCEIAMDQDYFSDILFYDLYPNTDAEAAAIGDDNEDAQDKVYSEKWEYAYEALKEIL